jgi:DNA-binding CsgD family transcriptional regulator
MRGKLKHPARLRMVLKYAYGEEFHASPGNGGYIGRYYGTRPRTRPYFGYCTPAASANRRRDVDFLRKPDLPGARRRRRRFGLSLKGLKRAELMNALRAIAEGEIGELLFITENTVKTHVVHIIGKLGVSDRVQAAVWAARHGILESI